MSCGSNSKKYYQYTYRELTMSYVWVKIGVCTVRERCGALSGVMDVATTVAHIV